MSAKVILPSLRVLVLLVYSGFTLLAFIHTQNPTTPRTYTVSVLPSGKKVIESISTAVAKKIPEPDETKDYSREKPYGKHDPIAFMEYWLLTNDGLGKVVRSCKRIIPVEATAGKMWFESHGGHSSLAEKDPTAIFGVKGKNGVKGYDDKDKEGVQYRSYENRAAAIKDFNMILTSDERWASKFYIERYIAWKALNPQYISKHYNIPLVVEEGLQPTWWYWILAMQAHPSDDLDKSIVSYAACGYPTHRIDKEGATKKMREARLNHSRKIISFMLRDGIPELINAYYVKYAKDWEDVGEIKAYGKMMSVEIEYDFEK